MERTDGHTARMFLEGIVASSGRVEFALDAMTRQVMCTSHPIPTLEVRCATSSLTAGRPKGRFKASHRRASVFRIGRDPARSAA